MSWVSAAVGVASFVYNNFFSGSGGSGGGIVSDIGSLFSGAGGGLSSLFSDFSSGLSDLFSGGFSQFLSQIDSVTGQIDNLVNSAANSIDQVVKPISQTISDITNVANDIQSNLVQPITQTIQTTYNSINNIVNDIGNAVHGGISEIVKLPGEIADQLTSVDAQFSRAVQELGTSNAQAVAEQLVPALPGVGAVPIGKLTAQFALPQTFTQEPAAFEEQIKLIDESGFPDVAQHIQDFKARMENAKGPFADIMRFLWDFLKVGDFLVATLSTVIEDIAQSARAANPVTLLGVGETITALRRGYLSADDANNELLKHGLDASRQELLYNLEQFLFGPREMIDLAARGIITADELATLSQQNNMNGDQLLALTQLMQHILGPADAAAALARGYIDQAGYDQIMTANKVADDVRKMIPLLEQTLPSGHLEMLLAGRIIASGNGFLRDSLQSVPDQDILNKYAAQQINPTQAQLDWIAHWSIPGPEWWMSAYFRGLVTRNQLDQAFQALNVPPEMWDNMLGVREEIPPVWLVPDIVATGVWTKDDAVSALMKLGYSQQTAELLYNYGYSKSKTSKATTAGDLSKLSLSNAKTMFAYGIINGSTYNEILQEHGYSLEAASLTVELLQFEQQLAERKAQAENIIADVQLGVTSAVDAQSSLYSLGMTDTEVATYMKKLESAIKANNKLPSEAELGKMLKKGLIDAPTFISTMGLLGYSEYWASLIMQTL